MHRTLFAGLLLLAGCQGVVGPMCRTCNDSFECPNLTIQERNQRARSELGLPDGSSQVGPSTNAGVPYGGGR
jgi:hypothetical protein